MIKNWIHKRKRRNNYDSIMARKHIQFQQALASADPDHIEPSRTRVVAAARRLIRWSEKNR